MREHPLLGNTHDRVLRSTLGGHTQQIAVGHTSTNAQTPLREASIIIETDFEFFQLFNDADAAANYVTDMFAYISLLYRRDINTALIINEIILYNSSASNPWSGNTTNDLLGELGDRWNAAPRNTVPRHHVHFISGKETMSGIALMDSLCEPNYAYAVSSGLQGRFDLNDPQIIWD